MSFAGLDRGLLRFLEQLRANNEREWFHAHRDDYETLLLEPARDFVEAMGEALRAFVPEIGADPRVNGSIFRITRDTRRLLSESARSRHEAARLFLLVLQLGSRGGFPTRGWGNALLEREPAPRELLDVEAALDRRLHVELLHDVGLLADQLAGA